MTATTATERARHKGAHPGPRDRLDVLLRKPVAFVLTASLLLVLFGWTFVANPDRVAPTKDPAYYTWRTEVLLTEEPGRLLEVTGPFDVFSSGYRVIAPVVGGFLRQVGGISSLHMTSVLMVILPVLTALLLAGFAYSQRRDPLLWHSVALLSASLMLTPPFVGYLDNMFCLFFLAAALPFIGELRTSWPARVAFGGFLLAAGLTHPTTLVFFGFTLGLMAGAKLLWRKFDFRSVIRDDGPMLVTALAAALVTYAIWKIGIWGEPAPLADAALPPPYGGDFFLERMRLWVKAMNPLLNGPLLVIGVVGLLATGRRWVEDELARVSILWLAPLAGLFGFVAGLTYPYYRFFNTTLAWVLLVGVGGYFAARFFLRISASGRASRLALLGIVALVAIAAANLATGFRTSGWNKAGGGWLPASQRDDLDTLRAHLEALDEEDRPVVFVIDQEPATPQVYGFMKLSGNTSRYGLPGGRIDQGFVYLGDISNLLAGDPTEVGQATYDKMSRGSLADIDENAGDVEPLYVVAGIFNATGANGSVNPMINSPITVDFGDADVWWVADRRVLSVAGDTAVPDPAPQPDEPGPLHLLLVLAGFAILLLPGALAFRWFMPAGTIAEGLGLVPAISMLLLSLAGIVVLTVARASFSVSLAWLSVAVAGAVGGWLFVRSRSARHAANAPAR